MVKEKKLREETILSLITEIALGLSDSMGISEIQSTQIADTMIKDIQNRFGGSEVYIHASGRNMKNQAIRDDWVDGMKILAIIKKHEVSKSTVYRIIAGL